LLRHHNIQRNDTRHNGTQHERQYCYSKRNLGRVLLFIVMLSVIMLGVDPLSVIMLSVSVVIVVAPSLLLMVCRPCINGTAVNEL